MGFAARRRRRRADVDRLARDRRFARTHSSAFRASTRSARRRAGSPGDPPRRGARCAGDSVRRSASAIRATLFVEHLKPQVRAPSRARPRHRTARGLATRNPRSHGVEHLRARPRGAARGAVLWVMAFCGPLLCEDSRLARAGFRVAHLSMPFHGGFSYSRLAASTCSIPWTRRSPRTSTSPNGSVIPLDGKLGHLRGLPRSSSQTVAFLIAGEHRGKRNVTAPLLGRRQRRSRPAPGASRDRRAPRSLMVQARQVHRAVYPRGDRPRHDRAGLSPAEGAATVVGEFAARLDAWLREHPADWERWSTIDPGGGPGPVARRRDPLRQSNHRTADTLRLRCTALTAPVGRPDSRPPDAHRLRRPVSAPRRTARRARRARSALTATYDRSREARVRTRRSGRSSERRDRRLRAGEAERLDGCPPGRNAACARALVSAPVAADIPPPLAEYP